MSDEDYLWDRSGQPAPDVERLEQVLGKLQWSGAQFDSERASRPGWWYARRPWLIAAATIALLLGSVALLHKTNLPAHDTAWQLSVANEKASSVEAGEIIETGNSSATMESAAVGELTIDPHSRLRLLNSRGDRHQLALDHGKIHAVIWAPPTEFVVDTPGAKAVDLGCEYTLRVADSGEGFLTVELGWVAFEWNKMESFIPQGAACTTRVGHGPDTPYFVDASVAFVKSLAEFDRSGGDEVLRRVLEEARQRDALSLWHLLERTKGAERAEVFSRFAGLVNLPPGVTRESVLIGDRKSMDTAWNALNLGDTNWWREWKRDW